MHPALMIAVMEERDRELARRTKYAWKRPIPEHNRSRRAAAPRSRRSGRGRLSAALSRWRIGMLADRHGPQRFLVPLVPLTGAGMALVAWSLAGADGLRTGLFLGGMLLLGLCYGGLQNLTLLISFSAVSRRHHNLASAVWNVGFDAGTALGSVAVGVVAGLTSFTTALLCAGAVAVATLPLAMRRSTASSTPDP